MFKNVDDIFSLDPDKRPDNNADEPDDSTLFLGSHREHVCYVLTQKQVREKKGLNTLIARVKEHIHAELIFNPLLSKDDLAPYRRIGLGYNIRYHQADLDEESLKGAYGLILTYDHPVKIKDVFIKD